MMKPITTLAALLLTIAVFGQKQQKEKFKPNVSIGTRNTLSFFNHDESMGKGIGGQARVQFGKRLNTEWFFDYLTSHPSFVNRHDAHAGWSLMFYMKDNYDFSRFMQPYFIAGHCIDKTILYDKTDNNNNKSRYSFATQAGIGTHLNITPKFDCSINGQYMLHFGKEINTTIVNDKPAFVMANSWEPDGHLLVSLSFNYKLSKL